MKKLLIIVNVGWFFVSHRLPIAVAARNRGYEVHVAAALDPQLDRTTVELLSRHDLVFHQLRFSRSGSHPFELIRDVADLWRLYNRVAPNIVHLVTIKPVLLGGMCARILGLRNVVLAIPGRGSVFSARGGIAALRRYVALLMYRFAYARRRSRVVIQNVEDQQYFISRGIFAPEDIRLIRGSGVDETEFRPMPEPKGDVIVVFASRMLREKGVADFVDAATELKRQGVEARFVLVGEPDQGNPKSHTIEEINRWVEDGAIEWWGFRADMNAVLAQCHLVCLPTYYGEGVPKILIEAAACGRPIVTTDTPGCRDIVRHGHNGLLVPPRDLGALMDALALLISDSEVRMEMGTRGRARVEKEFSLAVVVRRTLDIYGEFAQ